MCTSAVDACLLVFMEEPLNFPSLRLFPNWKASLIAFDFYGSSLVMVFFFGWVRVRTLRFGLNPHVRFPGFEHDLSRDSFLEM